jgi:transposase
MNNRILSLLGLQGLGILSIKEYHRFIFIYVYLIRKTANCPKCGKRTKTVYDQRPPLMVKHLKIGFRLTYLILFKRRFNCKLCKSVFTEKLTQVGKWQRKTKSMDEQVIEYLKEISFAGTKRRLGVSYSSQVKLLKKTVNESEVDWQKEAVKPVSLGIDEHSFSGHDMLITLTNLTVPKLITILPNDRKTTLDSLLSSIPENLKRNISSVAIDMKQMYKLSVKRYLPNTLVTVDHFHVIYDANKRIEEERRILQNVFKVKIPKWLFIKNKENLSPKEKDLARSIFEKYPDLKFYWFIKENLREMYKLNNRKEAEEKLSTLIRLMYKERDSGLTNWANMLFNWKDEILNFFTTGITNAYTEGVNTKLKLIKRTGFGFRNKEVYIKKAILAFSPFLILPHLFN